MYRCVAFQLIMIRIEHITSIDQIMIYSLKLMNNNKINFISKETSHKMSWTNITWMKWTINSKEYWLSLTSHTYIKCINSMNRKYAWEIECWVGFPRDFDGFIVNIIHDTVAIRKSALSLRAIHVNCLLIYLTPHTPAMIIIIMFYVSW